MSTGYTSPHGGAVAADVEVISAEKQAELIREYDAESNFRKLVGPAGLLVTTLAVVLSSFHIYTAGFGLLDEIKHRSFHLSLVLALIFLVFPRPRLPSATNLAVRAWLWGAAFAAFYVFLRYAKLWERTTLKQDDAQTQDSSCRPGENVGRGRGPGAGTHQVSVPLGPSLPRSD